MKKVLKIKRQEAEDAAYFLFMEEDRTLFKADCKTKTIKGQDLYTSLYSNVDPKEILEIEIDQNELSDEDKKKFGNYVVDLFQHINEAMIKQFSVSNE